MREIKFRVFDGKSMQKIGVIDFESGKSMDYYNFFDGYAGEYYDFNKYPLMQFVGIMDKNAVEIYEGDIVHQTGYMEGFNHIVVFYDSRFCLMWNNTYTDYISTANVEVIGNIYQDKHLLI